MLRITHTFARLEISKPAFDEIANKLKAAGYDHAFMVDDGVALIDMHGIAVTPVVIDKSDDARRERPETG